MGLNWGSIKLSWGQWCLVEINGDPVEVTGIIRAKWGSVDVTGAQLSGVSLGFNEYQWISLGVS